MPESIQPGCDDQPKWHWYNISRDLEEQGGLQGVTIDPLSVQGCSCEGETKKGTRFVISWAPDMFLLLSVTQDEKELVDAFAAVVGYRPFCRYVSRESSLLTYEWDKQDPAGRFAELKRAGETNLERVV